MTSRDEAPASVSAAPTVGHHTAPPPDLTPRGVRLGLLAARDGALRFYRSDDVTFAASIAFYALLSFFPFLLLMIEALNAIPLRDQDASLLQVIVGALPAHFDFLAAQFQALGGVWGRAGIAGTILTIWASMGVFSAISSSVNYAWGVEMRHSYLKNKLIAFLMLMTAGALLFATLSVVSAAEMARASWFVSVIDRMPVLTELQSFLIRNADTPMFIVVVGLIYFFVPNAKVRFGDVWFGAVLAGVFWRIAFAGFAWYVRDFSRFNVHGSIAAVVVFMIWVDVSAMILLYGVEVTAASARLRRGSPGDAPTPAVRT